MIAYDSAPTSDRTSAGRPVTDRPGASSHGSQAAGAAGPDQVPDPIAPLFENFAQLSELFGFYATTRTDAFRVKLGKLLTGALLGVVAGVAGLAAVVIATGFVLEASATGLGLLYGDRYWLGQLTVGAVLLVATFVGVRMLTKRMTSTARRTLMDKYERLQKRQRERFGRDVEQMAKDPTNR